MNKKNLLLCFVLMSSLLLTGCMIDLSLSKEKVKENGIQLGIKIDSGGNMIYNDEDCGFRMIVPQNEQNKIREKVKIYKQLVANTNRYLVEFIFPSINKKYHDPYLPKNMKGYVSIIRISCIPREESNYIESELGNRNALEGERFGRKFWGSNNGFSLVLSIGGMSKEEWEISTTGIDWQNIYDVFVNGSGWIIGVSNGHTYSPREASNVAVGTGTLLSRWVQKLHSTGQNIIYRNEDFGFQLQLPAEFSGGEVFESYKLHRLYGNLDYYALGSISFTFPTKNFESCFQDDLYGGFTPGRSPGYVDLFGIFYYTHDIYQSMKDEWNKHEEDRVYSDEFEGRIIGNNNKYYFIRDGVLDDKLVTEVVPRWNREDLTGYIQDNFTTFDI